MITDNEEFVDLKSTFLKDYKSLRLSTCYTDERHVYDAANDGFDSGSEAAETILTAQHDKEVIEFSNWKLNKISTTLKVLDENEFLFLQRGHEKWERVSDFDLLKTFRKEKENGSNKG